MWRRQYLYVSSRTSLERAAKEGDGPVGEHTLVVEKRVGRIEISGPTRECRPPKPKYVRNPIAHQYYEGKLKRRP